MKKSSRTTDMIAQVRHEERLRRLEMMLLRGVTNRRDMAVAFGVNVALVDNMLSEIRSRWQAEKADQVFDLKETRSRQLEHVYFLTLQSFERSRIGGPHTVKQKKVCTWCAGSGREEDVPDHWIECQACSGSGEIEFESQENRELPGDPIYLRLAKDLIIELAKLDGAYPATMGGRQMTLTSNRLEGGQLQTEISELFFEDADPELVMRAMRAMDELKHSTSTSKEESGTVHVIGQDDTAESI